MPWDAIVYAVEAYLSDRSGTRFLPMIMCASVGIAGYAMLIAPESPSTWYLVTYLVTVQRGFPSTTPRREARSLYRNPFDSHKY